MDVAVMLGGFPRKAGMERKDVMSKNVSIYAAQAAALEKHANKGVKVRLGGADTAATYTPAWYTARRTKKPVVCHLRDHPAPGLAQGVRRCTHWCPYCLCPTPALPCCLSTAAHADRSWWWQTPPTPTP